MTALPNLPRRPFPFAPDAERNRADLAFSCGNCGKHFATKGEKRRHKLSGCKTDGEARTNAGEGTPVDDAGKFGRPQDHITPEIKAQANAEWAAMDGRGRLPKGWTWPRKLRGKS